MYAAQPIISDIGATIGIPVASSGVILTFAQVAYCALAYYFWSRLAMSSKAGISS